MSENQLILHPADPAATPDLPRVLEALQACGFVGAPLDAPAGHWRPGERFLELLTFLGCSPVVSLGEPGSTGDEFCHLTLDGLSDSPRFVAGANAKVPRCRCGHRFEDWRERIGADASPLASWACPGCGETVPARRLRWRQCAGFGRVFLRVYGVFEGEAVPGEELLRVLGGYGGEWGYFYFRGR